MKPFLLVSLAVLLILGCRKDFGPTNNDYVETVRKGLQDSLGTADFGALDFSKAARSSVDSVGLYFLRVPFKRMKEDEDFVMVQTTEAGIIQKGKIVHLQGKVDDLTNGSRTSKTWNGSVSLSSLDRKDIFQSPIQNGYITAFRQQNRFRMSSHAPEENMMQEVIIT